MPRTSRIPVACGIDVGSTNAKVVVLDRDGAVAARARRRTPRDPAGLIDAEALLAAIDEMVREVCGDTYEVHAICGAGVGEDGILVDGALRPVTRALAWFDPRRASVLDDLRPALGPDDSFDARTIPVAALVGWAWARAQPGADAAGRWIALADLVGVAWSGTPFLGETLAARTAAWRSPARAWDRDRVEATLGTLDLLPPVVPTGEVVAPLTAAPLRADGIVAPDAVVVAGGHDHPIAGWGVQLLAPGAVLDSMGTAEVVVAQSPETPSVRSDGVEIAPGIRSRGTTVLRVEELTRNVQWASQDRRVAERIRALLTGSAAPLPVLDSGYFRPGSHGGGAPAWAPDAPRDPAARAAAVLGALAHAGRAAVRAVRGGAPEGDVRLAGGWVRSPGWVTIKWEVNGTRTAPILEPEVTAVGAALLAATARGWSPDPARALGGFAAEFHGAH